MASHLLDNPVWAALNGPHRGFGVPEGRFVRYRADVGLFLAGENPADRFADVGDALRPGDVVGIVTTAPIDLPRGMEVVEIARAPQMVAAQFLPVAAATTKLRRLDHADVPAMLDLTGLTHPGPFFARTIDLGHYFGAFDGSRLVAMAGERMRVPGFTEISAVCTHPDFQGRGFAKSLMSVVGREIVARGETPILHVRAGNAVAIGTYKTLGFAIRREMLFNVLKRSA